MGTLIEGSLGAECMAEIVLMEDDDYLSVNIKLQIEEMAHRVIGLTDQAEKAIEVPEELIADIIIKLLHKSIQGDGHVESAVMRQFCCMHYSLIIGYIYN